MRFQRGIGMLLAGATILSLATPVAAADPVVGIQGSMGQYVPPTAGNHDGFGAVVTNTGTAEELVTATIERFDATTPALGGRILSQAAFKLAPGARCLIAVRWTVTAAQAANPSAYKGRLSVVAKLVTPPPSTGTGVITQAGIGMGKRIATSVDEPTLRGGNTIPNQTLTICGTSTTFTPPMFTVAGYNSIWTGATKRNLLANPQRAGQALIVRKLETYASDRWGTRLTNGQKPAVITPTGSGTKGWTIPATRNCIIPAGISGLVTGQFTTVKWQTAVPLGNTSGVVYQNSYDIVMGDTKPSYFVDNGGWVAGQPYPACAAAN